MATNIADRTNFTELENCALFERSGVFVNTIIQNTSEDAHIQGTIRVIEKEDCSIWVKWTPDDLENGTGDNTSRSHRYIIEFDIKDLKSFKRTSPKIGWSYMIFIMKDGSNFPSLHFHEGGTKTLITILERYLSINKSPNDAHLYLVREYDPTALHKSFQELNLFDEPNHKENMVTRFVKDPYTTTWSGFSKVTKFLHHQMLASGTHEGFATPSFQDLMAEEREHGDVSLRMSEDSGFEVISKKEEPPILPLRQEIKRGSPVTVEQWRRHLDQEGHVTCVETLRQQIFRGGLVPELRVDVWKFLLGVYPWDSSKSTRENIRKKLCDDYFCMKLQWKSITKEQERRFSIMRERISLVDKDVHRTDRTHDFYQGDDNPNLRLLNDVLLTYGMYDFDLGYVQGMSDLLAPLLVVMENEVDAFWCFVGFMRRMSRNFELDQAGMKSQLSQLQTLVQLLDPELCNYLESNESSNMYFCFRWVLIHFKREFSFEEVMKLWEVLWTDEPCENFHLLVCLAILDQQRHVLIDNRFGFTEILKHINDTAFNIDLDRTLSLAETMWLQLLDLHKEQRLPDDVAKIVGLRLQTKSSRSGSKASD